ncbi:MAG: MazG family protein [Clostridia bacterium]|nr:MazG family protein [Clostridia bacterium]
MSLTLIGLGVTEKDVTLAAAEKISKAEVVLLKTDMTANYPFFTERGIKVSTMDHLYGKSRNFDTLAKNVAAEVIAAAKDKEAVYCVDGSVLEDNACKLILAKAKGTEVISGVSKVSSALEKLGISGGYSAVSAYDLGDFYLSGGTLCVYDIDSEPLAGEVKLRLMEEYGDECPCVAFYGNKTEKILLYEADRLPVYDYSTRLVITPREFLRKDGYNFDDLCRIIKLLRAENGCPWDRAQTHESIRINAIEEVYEMVDAIDRKDDERLTEEIGDVLMQAVFHTELAEERGALTRGEVLTGVCKKLISRHTHIFFGDHAANASEALDVWDKNKQKEHGYSLKQAVKDVPECFPALLRAEKVQKRSAKAGWNAGDFTEAENLVVSLAEKLAAETDVGAITRDSGDLLFACVNLARLKGAECEVALKDKTSAFVRDFAGEDD